MATRWIRRRIHAPWWASHNTTPTYWDTTRHFLLRESVYEVIAWLGITGSSMTPHQQVAALQRMSGVLHVRSPPVSRQTLPTSV
eukprot:9068197-Pyramimonas_sp.AAC.1